MSAVHVLEGVLHADPAEPVAQLAFEVPEACTRVTVRYRHDPGHILDLGLLDPTAEPFPSAAGFRGWSGGARSEAFVAEHDATPGYLPGRLPAGRWQVLLGRARIGPEGCAYRVEVEVETGGPAGSSPARGAAPAPPDSGPAEPGPRPAFVARTAAALDDPWFPGDLQSHTHHSDAQGSVDELLAAAHARGLRYLAVTDHNTVSHHADLRRHQGGPVLPIAGMEVTTYRGHANVWGASSWVDFRIAGDADVAVMVRRGHELGGLVSVNHPKTQPGCIGCDWEYPVPEDVDAFEAWQGPWPLRNWESLARYDRLLDAGRRLTLVGGSDRHQPAGPERDPEALRVGSPTTWLQLPRLGVPEALRSLRDGRATVSEGPRGPLLEVRSGPVPMGGRLPAAAEHRVTASVRGAVGERLRWVGAQGVLREVPVVGEAFEDVYVWRPDGPFLRAEVVADVGLAARRAELAAWSAARPLPFGITLDEVFAHPWVVALSNPLYA